MFLLTHFRSKYDHSRIQKQKLEESRDEKNRNSPFEMEIRIDHGIRMILNPIYTLKIRISLKGDVKLFVL